MRQSRQGWPEGRQWFQVGIVTATVISPLVSRWRSLRAAERARAVWEARRTTAPWQWSRTGGPAQDVAPSAVPAAPAALAEARTRVQPGLWLAGATIGLAAAGALAFVVARRRLRESEVPVEIPWPQGSNGLAALADHLAPSAPTPDPSATGTVEPDEILDAPEADDQVAEAVDAASARLAATSVPLAYQSAAYAEDADAPSPVSLDEEGAQVIGDTSTRLYRTAGMADLPAPERRILFASVDQAEAAGYRPDPTLPGAGSDDR